MSPVLNRALVSAGMLLLSGLAVQESRAASELPALFPLTPVASAPRLLAQYHPPAQHTEDWYEGPSPSEVRNDFMRYGFNPTADPYRYENCYDKERKRNVDCRTLRRDQYRREREFRRDCWDLTKERAPYCEDIQGVSR